MSASGSGLGLDGCALPLRPRRWRHSRWSVIGASPVAAEPVPEPAPLPEPAVPTFVNGLSQAVFPTGSINWVNYDLWVETEVDSDFDGKNTCRMYVLVLTDGTTHTAVVRFK